MKAPFPYFGGKRDVAPLVWQRLGLVKQYIEPFCGTAAVLLASPQAASLEVVNDINGFIANFWRTVKHQPDKVAEWADYPVSHIDLGARHVWLLEQRPRIGAEMQDPNWIGDAQVAGWWLWGQCCWIGSGWCDWARQDTARGQRGYGDSGDGQDTATLGATGLGKIPHVSSAGMGIQATGKIPHVSDAGLGIQAIGQIPHAGDAGRGIQAIGQIPHAGNAGMGDLLTSSGRVAWDWLHKLQARLERVRVTHGSWERCLNHRYGAESTAVFLDPPYRAYEGVYGADAGKPIADEVEAWAAANPTLRVAVCGHLGDYPALDGWTQVPWSRKRLTYGGSETTDNECIWFSPACINVDASAKQQSLFEVA